MFLSRTPLFLVQDPLGDPPPSLASLSLSLCFYLGAVRAPLLKLLLKREHIQWGLSQSLSVSIKDPGNTTLSREPLLKGQWDPGSFATWVPAPPIPSLSWEKRKNTGIYAANQLFMNGMWTLQSVVPGTERRRHLLRPNRRSHLRHHSLQQHDMNPHCCSAPHIWWESGTAAFIYTTADTPVCFGWSGLFKQIPRHSDDTILLMWSDKYIFLVTFLPFPVVVIIKILKCHVKLRLKHFKLLTS